MKTAKINILAPVHFAAGEIVDGVALAAPRWAMSGDVEVTASRAQELERGGYAEIVAIGGESVVWPSCCSGCHDHG